MKWKAKRRCVASLRLGHTARSRSLQALRLSFTVSTLALMINLALAGAIRGSIASPAVGALAMSCAGMWIGQALRLRMQPAAFRFWFFIGLLSLGMYLKVRSIV